MYVLGQVVGQANLTEFTFRNSTDSLSVGRLNSSSGFRRFMHGWIDELRFTKGVARYAGSFVPPQGPFSRYQAQGSAFSAATTRGRVSRNRCAGSHPRSARAREMSSS